MKVSLVGFGDSASSPARSGYERLLGLPDYLPDRLLHLEDGNIVDEGSHAALVAKGGAYAELHAAHCAPRCPTDLPGVEPAHAV